MKTFRCSFRIRIVAVLFAINFSANAAVVGSVVAWGANGNGQTNVPVAAQAGVTAIAAGSEHAVALKTNGTVVAWGWNNFNQTNVPPGLAGVTGIAAGFGHTVALMSNGTVVAWGANGGGQTNVPPGLSGVTAVAARDNYTVALKSDGTVAAWGANLSGTTNVPTGLSGVVAIAAGERHALALKRDGTLVTWGANDSGQRTVPAAAQSGVVAIAARGSHTVALRNDGTVITWGANSQNQTNAPVTAQSAVVAIAAGAFHSVAVKSDGTIVAWGSNDIGQTNAPANLGVVTAIAAGDFFNLALVIAPSPIAPILLSQPWSQTAREGQDVSFTVLAVGTSPLNYQWRREGTNLSGATSATYTLTNVQTNQAGNYSVVVSNVVDSVTSAPPAVLTVLPAGPLAEVIQSAFLVKYGSLAQTNEGPAGTEGLPSFQSAYNFQANVSANATNLFVGASVKPPGGSATNLALFFPPIAFVNVPFGSRPLLDAAYPDGSYEFRVQSDSTGVRTFTLPLSGALPNQPQLLNWTAAQALNPAQDFTLRWNAFVGGTTNDMIYVSFYGPGTNYFSGSRGTPGALDGTATALTIPAGTLSGPDNTYDVFITFGKSVVLDTNSHPGVTLESEVSAQTFTRIRAGTMISAPVIYTATTASAVVGQSFNYQIVADNGPTSFGATGLPAGLSLNPATGLISGTPTMAGTNTVTLLASNAGGTGTTNLTLAVVETAPLSQDIEGVLLLKSVEYTQMNAGPATLVPASFSFYATVGERITNSLAGVSVTPPSGISTNLVRVGTNVFATRASGASFSNQAELNMVYPDGTYGVQIQTVTNGVRTITLPLTGGLPTTAPHLLNWTAARGFNPAQDFTLTWNAFEGGTTNDAVYLTLVTVFPVFRVVYDSPRPGTPGALDGTATQFTLPAGTVSASSLHLLFIRFAKTVANDTNTHPGVTLRSELQAQTQVFINTVATNAPLFTTVPLSQTVSAGTNVTFTVEATSSAPLTYQWRKNGAPVPDATNTSLVLTSVRRADGGLYSVQLSNSFGGVVSSDAILSVRVPQQLQPPQGQPDGSFRLHFGPNDGFALNNGDLARFVAQASTNLVDWTDLPNALVLTNGLLRLGDPASHARLRRFYRVLER